MANHTDAVEFIKKWEGGLTGHPADSASSFPAPCGNDPRYNAPYHTNKGITWRTYTSAVTSPSCDEFLVMPDAVWLYIWKAKYWDAVLGDAIKNQAIANAYASWAWGSGVTGANNLMISMLTSKYGYTMAQVASPYNRVIVLNELTARDGGAELFKTMIETREQFFRSLSSFSTFGNGWLNRLEEFKRYNQKYVGQQVNTSKTLIYVVLAFVVVAIALYFAL
jgi:lysozyme family protein